MKNYPFGIEDENVFKFNRFSYDSQTHINAKGYRKFVFAEFD